MSWDDPVAGGSGRHRTARIERHAGTGFCPGRRSCLFWPPPGWRTMSRCSRPLLVIDGNSFAHRAFHGVPKLICRCGGRGGGAMVGFADFLLRLFESEQPRAVLVGWDTLEFAQFPPKTVPRLPKRAGFRCGTGRSVGGLARVCHRVRLCERKGFRFRGRRLSCRGRGRRGAPAWNCARRQRRSRCISACLRRHDHSSSGQGRRTSTHWPG